jgi:mannose/fructose-specific phosphotransferase system component IIA
MTPPFPTLLVSHRGFGEGLLAAAEAILGERPAVDHLSNEGLSPDALGAAIDAWVAGHPGPAVILVDLGFGSCCQTARRVTRDRDTVAVVAGVNLPALLAAVRSRELADLPAFLRHIEERGRGGFELYLGGARI